MSTVRAYVGDMRRYNCREQAAAITCPSFITDNETDAVSTGQGQKLFDAAHLPEDVPPIPAGEGAEGHCEGMAPVVFWTAAFDWLDDDPGLTALGARYATVGRWALGCPRHDGDGRTARNARLTSTAGLSRRFRREPHSTDIDSAYSWRMAVNRRRRARAARRRKRRMDRVEHDLSDEQWTVLKAAWGGCAYCGAIDKPLQRDCVLALSRGGRYTLDNIVPACGSCNTSKCNDEVTSWLRRKRLDERGFLLRHLEIKTALAL